MSEARSVQGRLVVEILGDICRRPQKSSSYQSRVLALLLRHAPRQTSFVVYHTLSTTTPTTTILSMGLTQQLTFHGDWTVPESTRDAPDMDLSFRRGSLPVLHLQERSHGVHLFLQIIQSPHIVTFLVSVRRNAEESRWWSCGWMVCGSWKCDVDVSSRRC